MIVRIGSAALLTINGQTNGCFCGPWISSLLESIQDLFGAVFFKQVGSCVHLTWLLSGWLFVVSSLNCDAENAGPVKSSYH